MSRVPGVPGVCLCLLVVGVQSLATAPVPAAEVQSRRAAAFAITPPVTELANRPVLDRLGEIEEVSRHPAKPAIARASGELDGALPRGGREGAEVMPVPTTFAGISIDPSSLSISFPPSPVGDVGPNHYVQATNSMPTSGVRSIGIFDKTTGAPIVPIFPLSQLFSGLGASPCNGGGDGEPMVLYDSFADRWLISESDLTSDPGHQCIAISQTGDPTGAYYVYDFVNPKPDLFLSPKFGVWSDGYYAASSQFSNVSSVFIGVGVFAFDRGKMLAGDPTASFVFFDMPAAPFDFSTNLLPSDADGVAPPPLGLAQRLYEVRANEFGDPADVLRVYEVVPNYGTPAASTLTVLSPDLALAPFDARQPSNNAIEQGTGAGSIGLDANGFQLMHRVQYRNLGTLTAPVNRWTGNFTVNVSGVNPTTAATYQGAPRWFILGGTGVAPPAVVDEGTHATDAGNGLTGQNRWMGSAALDHQGNLALGYSRSAAIAGTFADIYIGGRLATDAPGSLVQGEVLMHAASGKQTISSGRWGAYSSMNVDPVDDCTFWYTTEFYAAPNSAVKWQTRIGHLAYPGCTASARGTVAVHVADCVTAAPIPGVTVEMTGGFVNTTDAAGNLVSNFSAAPGSYTVVASDPFALSGPGASAPAAVVDGATTSVNLCLTGSAFLESSGHALVAENCAAPNGAPDPNEGVAVNLCVTNAAGATAPTFNLVATLQTTGNVVSPSGPQSYGALPPGASACRSFSFGVDAGAPCGGTVTATLALVDGATSFPDLSFPFVIGTSVLGGLTTFANTAAITIPATDTQGVSTPFPSDIVVSGLTGTVADVNLTLNQFSHTFPADVDIVLVGPGGQRIQVMSDQGLGTDAVGVGLTFDDEAAGPVVPAVTGAYRPTPGSYVHPVPAGPFGSQLSVFDGASGNGTWSLYVFDDEGQDLGAIAGGWSLSITVNDPVCSTGCVVPVELLDFSVDGGGKR